MSTVEEDIKKAGCDTAPRITPKHITEVIKEVDYYVFPKTQLTICCMTLENGFTVTGESACASPENFNKAIGERISYDMALNKIWMLEGYLLKQLLYDTYHPHFDNNER